MASNIHSLGDYREQRSGPQYGMQQIGPNPADIRCIDLFFPGFTVKSFILWVSVFQAICFFAACIVGSVELVPTGTKMDALGSCAAVGQVWRFVTPIFMHASIMHLMFNCFFQMRMGFPLERQFTVWRIVLLYFASGIAGNCVSMAWTPCVPGVGSSTSGFGLIGLIFAQMALQWHMVTNRDGMIFNIVMFIFISVMFTLAPNSNIGWRSHLGGWAAGFLIGIIMHHAMDNKPSWYNIGFTSAIVGLVGLYTSTLAVLYAIPMDSRGCPPCK